MPKAVVVDYPLEIQRKHKPEGSNLPLTLKFTQCLVLSYLLFGLVEREENAGLGGNPAWIRLRSSHGTRGDHDRPRCRDFGLGVLWCQWSAPLLEDPGICAREKRCTKHCDGEEWTPSTGMKKQTPSWWPGAKGPGKAVWQGKMEILVLWNIILGQLKLGP